MNRSYFPMVYMNQLCIELSITLQNIVFLLLTFMRSVYIYLSLSITSCLQNWNNGVHLTRYESFEQTNYDAAVEPLDFCVKRTGGTAKFGKAIYGEHLVSKVTTNFIM